MVGGGRIGLAVQQVGAFEPRVERHVERCVEGSVGGQSRHELPVVGEADRYAQIFGLIVLVERGVGISLIGVAGEAGVLQARAQLPMVAELLAQREGERPVWQHLSF